MDDFIKTLLTTLFGFLHQRHSPCIGLFHLLLTRQLDACQLFFRKYLPGALDAYLLVAQHMWVNRNMLAGILNTKGYRKAESDALDCAFYWLEVVDLVDCANRLAGELSYGQQRRLEIARAMCTRPQIICLDEPAAGLNPQETEALSAMIRLLRDEHDLTVVLIEHDMGMVMSISDHIVVLDHGNVIAEGGPDAIRNDPKVIAAYLGADEEELV